MKNRSLGNIFATPTYQKISRLVTIALLKDNGKEGERPKAIGRKVVPNYRLRTPKQSFAYTQTIIRLYANADGHKKRESHNETPSFMLLRRSRLHTGGSYPFINA